MGGGRPWLARMEAEDVIENSEAIQARLFTELSLKRGEKGGAA